MAVERGDVAEADDPFRVLLEFFEAQFVDDTHHTIAPPGTKDGFYLPVVEHFLQVGTSLIVCPAKSEIALADGSSGYDLESPGFELADCRCGIFRGNIAGGAGDTDRVAFAEVGRPAVKRFLFIPVLNRHRKRTDSGRTQ